jgi:hypothetical protein
VELSPLTRAVLAARMYHVVMPAAAAAAAKGKKGGAGPHRSRVTDRGSHGRMTTLAPPERVVCVLAPDLAAKTPTFPHEGAVFESMLDVAGEKKLQTVTWLKKLPRTVAI